MDNGKGNNNWRCVAIVAVVMLVLGMGGFGIYYNLHQSIQKQEIKQDLNLLKQSQSHEINQALLKQDLTHWMKTMQNSIQQLHTVSGF